METFEGGFYEEAFKDRSRMVPLESWRAEDLKLWNLAHEEKYHGTIGPAVRLNLPGDSSPEAIAKAVSFGVRQLLRGDQALRSKAVSWLFDGLPNSLPADLLDDTFRPVWNSMRRLPFTDEEVGDALGTVAMLLAAGFRFSQSRKTQLELFSKYFGESMAVAFGHEDRSGSEGFVDLETLRGSLRCDMSNLISDKYKDRATLPDLFRMIYNPKLMFEFESFKKLFAREVIPTQALLKRDVLIANPTRLMTFGLP